MGGAVQPVDCFSINDGVLLTKLRKIRYNSGNGRVLDLVMRHFYLLVRNEIARRGDDVSGQNHRS